MKRRLLPVMLVGWIALPIVSIAWYAAIVAGSPEPHRGGFFWPGFFFTPWVAGLVGIIWAYRQARATCKLCKAATGGKGQCPTCGYYQGARTAACPNCLAPVLAVATQCYKCGVALSSTNPAPAVPPAAFSPYAPYLFEDRTPKP